MPSDEKQHDDSETMKRNDENWKEEAQKQRRRRKLGI